MGGRSRQRHVHTDRRLVRHGVHHGRKLRNELPKGFGGGEAAEVGLAAALTNDRRVAPFVQNHLVIAGHYVDG